MNVSRRAERAYRGILLPWLYGRGQMHLQPDEAGLIRTFSQNIRGGRVLDLGIGGGRTTQHLAPLASRYLGLDFSSQMVTLAQRRFPAVDIEVGDARDLSHLPRSAWDFVLFSNCGLDSLDVADRRAVLRAVRPLLASGGVFAYATHNCRSLPVPPPWSLSRLRGARTARGLIRRALMWPVGIANHLLMHRPAEQVDGYRLVHDAGEGLYNLFVLYSSAAREAALLADEGFCLDRLVDSCGIERSPAEIDASSDVWFTCVARVA